MATVWPILMHIFTIGAVFLMMRAMEGLPLRNKLAVMALVVVVMLITYFRTKNGWV